MKSMKNILGFKEFQVAGEKQCPTCGEMFPLYTTPKGVLGACKPCKDREFIKSLKLPSLEELKGLKRKNKLLQFEKPPADLVDATVMRMSLNTKRNSVRNKLPLNTSNSLMETSL